MPKITKKGSKLLNLLKTFSNPIGNVATAYHNFQQISQYHVDVAQDLRVASNTEKTLIYSQFSNSFLSAVFSSIAVGKIATDFAKSGFNTVGDLTPMAAPFMAWAGIFVNASFSISEIKKFRQKSLELKDMQHLLTILEEELQQKYSDYTGYLGNTSPIPTNTLKDALKDNRKKIEQTNNLSQWVLELQSLDLHTLIQQQAFIMFHEHDREYSITNIKGMFSTPSDGRYSFVNLYQMAIEDKIRNIAQSPNFGQDGQTGELLQQYVIGLQHQAQYQAALPLLKNSKNHHIARFALSVALLGLAIAVTIASAGALSPAVGGALVFVSTSINLAMQYHQSYLDEKEQKIKQFIDPVTTQLDLLDNRITAGEELPHFTSTIDDHQSYQSLLTQLIPVISAASDPLSQPLKTFITTPEFMTLMNADRYADAILQLKNEVHRIKAEASRWKRFSLNKHGLYELIKTIDPNDMSSSSEAIKTYETKQAQMQSRTHRRLRRRATPLMTLTNDADVENTLTPSVEAQRSSRVLQRSRAASANLETEVSIDHSIAPDIRQAVVAAFTASD